jgi:citrate lyase subunit beta/citryl-CoA lyase
VSINRKRRVLIIFLALEERFYYKAQSLDVDGVIIDLEDGIALSHKEEARLRMKNFLAKYSIQDKELIIRINSFRSGYGLRDLEVALECEPNSNLYPKTEEPNEIEQLDNILSENQAKLGCSKQIDLIPLIETPIGFLRADKILSTSQRVTATFLGTEDLCSAFMSERKPITEMALLLYG